MHGFIANSNLLLSSIAELARNCEFSTFIDNFPTSAGRFQELGERDSTIYNILAKGIYLCYISGDATLRFLAFSLKHILRKFGKLPRMGKMSSKKKVRSISSLIKTTPLPSRKRNLECMEDDSVKKFILDTSDLEPIHDMSSQNVPQDSDHSVILDFATIEDNAFEEAQEFAVPNIPFLHVIDESLDATDVKNTPYFKDLVSKSAALSTLPKILDLSRITSKTYFKFLRNKDHVEKIDLLMDVYVSPEDALVSDLRSIQYHTTNEFVGKRELCLLCQRLWEGCYNRGNVQPSLARDYGLWEIHRCYDEQKKKKKKGR